MEPGTGWKPVGGESPLRVRLPPLLLGGMFPRANRLRAFHDCVRAEKSNGPRVPRPGLE